MKNHGRILWVLYMAGHTHLRLWINGFREFGCDPALTFHNSNRYMNYLWLLNSLVGIIVLVLVTLSFYVSRCIETIRHWVFADWYSHTTQWPIGFIRELRSSCQWVMILPRSGSVRTYNLQQLPIDGRRLRPCVFTLRKPPLSFILNRERWFLAVNTV